MPVAAEVQCVGWGPAGGTRPLVDAPDSAEVAVQIGSDVADEGSHALVARGEPVDHVVGEPGSELDRVDPTSAVMFVADDGFSISDLASIGELKAITAVDPHRVRTDELELADDVEARLFDQLSTCSILGQLVTFNSTPGQEPLP